MRKRLRRDTFFALVCVVALYAIGDAVFAPAPVPKEPGFVDTVLGSRAVVAAIRLAVLFAAAFVVASVVALMARGQWLTRVGPVEVSGRVHKVEAENKQLKNSVDSMWQAFLDLQQDLATVRITQPSSARSKE